ncbi:hypothetical protein Tco_0423932 [Tanacetum coccineum]
MKYEYLHNDGYVFIDYSWERALSIYGDVYPEWCLEFFSTMYFDKGVDRTKLMTEKCVWFRLCGVEKVLTLPEFEILLRLYEEGELNHRLFAIHFTKLEVDDKLFNHEMFWNFEVETKAGSKERCQKRDMWMMSALEESRGINLAWVIVEHLCKHAPGLKENSLILRSIMCQDYLKSVVYLNEEGSGKSFQNQSKMKH